MMFFNVRGLMGMIFGIALTCIICSVLLNYEFSGGVAVINYVTISFFFASIYGFTLDRCEESGIFKSYEINLKHATFEYDKSHPGRRLALAGFPLAAWPLFLLSLTSLLWLVDTMAGIHFAENSEYFSCWSVMLFSFAVSFIYGFLTKNTRKI